MIRSKTSAQKKALRKLFEPRPLASAGIPPRAQITRQVLVTRGSRRP